MPYREQPTIETVRFPVRTPPLYRATLGLVAALALLGVGVLGFGGGLGSPGFIFVAVSLVAFFVGFWATTEPYRIGGGRGEIVIDADTITVPGHRRGDLVRMPLSGLAYQRVPMLVRFSLFAGAIPVGTVRRGEVVVLRSGLTSRTLSTLTSVDAAFADRLIAVLTERTIPAPQLEKMEALMEEALRAFAGSGPGKRVGGEAVPPEEDAELERRIDEALLSEKE